MWPYVNHSWQEGHLDTLNSKDLFPKAPKKVAFFGRTFDYYSECGSTLSFII